MLNIGDKVYMADFGEGIVKKIKLNEICGRILRYYYISFISDNIDFLIPENQLRKYRVKKLNKGGGKQDTINFIKFAHTRIFKKWAKDFNVIIKGVEIK